MTHDPDPTRLQLARVLFRRWLIASLSLVPGVLSGWLVAGLMSGPDPLAELAYTAPANGAIWAGVSLFGGLVAVAVFGVLRNGAALKPRDLRPINWRFAFAFAAPLAILCVAGAVIGRLMGLNMHDGGAAPVGALAMLMTTVMLADRFTPFRERLVGEEPR